MRGEGQTESDGLLYCASAVLVEASSAVKMPPGHDTEKIPTTARQYWGHRKPMLATNYQSCSSSSELGSEEARKATTISRRKGRGSITHMELRVEEPTKRRHKNKNPPPQKQQQTASPKRKTAEQGAFLSAYVPPARLFFALQQDISLSPPPPSPHSNNNDALPACRTAQVPSSTCVGFLAGCFRRAGDSVRAVPCWRGPSDKG